MDTREDIENAAAAWLFKRDAGEWSAADEAELSAWLQASIAHRVVFLRLESAWCEASRLKAVGAGLDRGSVPSPQALATRAPIESIGGTSQEPVPEAGDESGRRHRFRALAASALLALVVGALWHYVPRESSYQTAVGGLEDVSMADGSHVTLNTDSIVSVMVSTTERRVDLQQGEAYFDVAKDPSRPFVVAAGAQRIVAVGTKFSVRRENESVRVVVSEGRVRMERSGKQNPTANVGAGSIARGDGEGLMIHKQALNEVERYLSWRQGFLVFESTPVADAVAEFNRYNRRKVVIEDARLSEMPIDGNFRADNVDAFLRLLESGFAVQVRQEPDRIIVSSQR